MSITVLKEHFSCVCDSTAASIAEAEAAEYKQIYVKGSKGIVLRHILRGEDRWVQTEVKTIPGYTEIELKTDLSHFFPKDAGKIPFELYRQIEAFFREVCKDKKTALEAMVFVMWNAEQGYFLWIPDQTVSAASAKFDYEQKPAGSIIANIHSHGSMNAFFSGTDNNDDATAIAFSGVFGYVDKPGECITVWRFNYYQTKIPVTVADIFAPPEFPEFEVPAEWVSRVKTAPVTTYQSHVYRPGSYNGPGSNLWMYEGYGEWGSEDWRGSSVNTNTGSQGGNSEEKNEVGAGRQPVSPRQSGRPLEKISPQEERLLLGNEAYSFQDLEGNTGARPTSISMVPLTEYELKKAVEDKFVFDLEKQTYVLREGMLITAADVRNISELHKVQSARAALGNQLTSGPAVRADINVGAVESKSLTISEIPAAPVLQVSPKSHPVLEKIESKKEQSTNANDGTVDDIPTLVDEIQELTMADLANIRAEHLANIREHVFINITEDPTLNNLPIPGYDDGQYEAIEAYHGPDVADAWFSIDAEMHNLSQQDELLETLVSDMVNLATEEGQGKIFKTLFQQLPAKVRAEIETNGL